MAEPSSPPQRNSPSLSIALPPSSPPTSPQMNSAPLSIAILPPSPSHSQPTPPPMNSPSLSIGPPLTIANSNHGYYQSTRSDEFVIHNSKNFGLSQVPMRVMFYLNKCWQDFKDEVLESLRYGFANGNAIFPLKIEVEDHVVAKQIPQASKFPNAKLLNKSDKSFAYINNLFMNNVGNIDPHATITSIHEFQISTPYGRACMDTFEKQIEITEAARGKANVVYGWYATPAEKVASTFFDGFKLLPNTLHPTIGAAIFLADLESPQHSLK
ncbi:hypothetical protein TSUD_308490 [Trifolium subterraneum]|nr:hypothetical protein TSUD_308490 [Trifolium subterraneum]